MYRALVGELEEAHSLYVGESAIEMDHSVEGMHAFFVLLGELDLDTLQRNVFETRISADRHRRARAERRE